MAQYRNLNLPTGIPLRIKGDVIIPSAFRLTAQGTISGGVIIENGTTLSTKYLGINAIAVDSAKLGNVVAAEYMLRDGSVAMTNTLRTTGIRIANNTSTKIIGSFTTAQIANQKIDIYFPASTNYIGTFDISVTGAYNFQNATGRLTKSFVFHGTNAGVISYQSTKVTESTGATAGQIAISDITWDATNLRWRIQIAQIPSNGSNTFVVMVEGFSSTHNTVETLQLTPIYTTDTTVFALQKQQINVDTITTAGHTILHSGNLDMSKYVRNDTISQQVTGDFSIAGNSTLYVGTGANTAGSIVLKSAGANGIQIAGATTGKLTGVNVYINALGNGEFAGTLTANKIAVINNEMVTNLNAELLAGKTELFYAKTESILETSGYGVHSGLVPAAQTPTPNMSVRINAGVVYTDTGRRYVIAQKDQSITAVSATYVRYDIIYIYGSKNPDGSPSGANEGTVGYAQGTPAATPLDPAIPAGAVKIAKITVPASPDGMVTIQSANISDQREWRHFSYDGAVFRVRRQPLSIESSLTSDTSSIAVSKPFKGTLWTNNITFPVGTTKVTWNHNLGLGTNYTVQLTSNSPSRHVYWENKLTNSVVICIDDISDVAVIVDADITAR